MKIELSNGEKSASFDIPPDMTSEQLFCQVEDWAAGLPIEVVTLSGTPDVIAESEVLDTLLSILGLDDLRGLLKCRRALEAAGRYVDDDDDIMYFIACVEHNDLSEIVDWEPATV